MWVPFFNNLHSIGTINRKHIIHKNGKNIQFTALVVIFSRWRNFSFGFDVFNHVRMSMNLYKYRQSIYKET